MGMTVTKIVKVDNTKKLQEIIKKLNSKKIRVGIFGKDDSFILMVGRVNEFGCTIRPVKGQHLAVPLKSNLVGISPRQFKDLFAYRDDKGELWLCKAIGKNKLDFWYWLPTSVTIPERSFIRGTYYNKKNEMQRFIETNLDQLFSFKISVDTYLNRVGEYLAGLTRQYLTDLKEPPKSSITLASAPGKTNPLINSGRLRESISWEIV